MNAWCRGARQLWLGLPLCAACTLLDLSKDIEQSSCATDDDCQALNTPTPSGFNSCMTWQCGSDKLCEVSRRDQDRDGFLPPECAPPGEGDCDDENPKRTPGKAEVCDGIDNDCDLRTDEGSLGLEPALALEFDGPLDDIAFSWSERTAELSLAYSLRGDPSVPGLATLSGDGDERGGPLDLEGLGDELQAGSKRVGLGALRGIRRFALALVEPVAPNRLWIGNVFDHDGPKASFDRVLLQQGLHCAAGEACATKLGMDQSSAATVPPTTSPAVAALGDQILVAYTRIPSGLRDSCAPQPDDGVRLPALLNMLLDPDPSPPQELTTMAVPLDDMGETRSPAILTVDTNLLMGDQEFGWIAGYVDRAGDLVVRRVTPGLELPTKDLKRAHERSARFSNVSLVTGRVEPGRTLVGVVMQLDCGVDAGVFFGVLAVTWDSLGQPSLTVMRDPSRVDTDGGERPRVAFNLERDTWGVAYVHDGTLLVRELDLNGIPAGAAPYDLGDAGSLDFAIVPGRAPAPDSFRVYRYRDQDPALEVVQLLECSGE